MAAAIIIQQRAEDAGRIKAWGAEPIDGAVGCDERRSLQVPIKP
jgi:hypothetical protein